MEKSPDKIQSAKVKTNCSRKRTNSGGGLPLPGFAGFAAEIESWLYFMIRGIGQISHSFHIIAKKSLFFINGAFSHNLVAHRSPMSNRLEGNILLSRNICNLIVTDPSYVQTKAIYNEYINEKNRSDRYYQNRSGEQIGLFVECQATDDLLISIGREEVHEKSNCKESDSVFIFGKTGTFTESANDDGSEIDMCKYSYLGSHLSDSGLTCIVKKDAYLSSTIDHKELEIDWTDFVLATVDDPSLEHEKDSFPLFEFFGKANDGEGIVDVYGLIEKEENSIEGNKIPLISGLLIKSREEE